MQQVSEGDSNLFDRTSILNVSNLSNASAHTCENLPVILAGGLTPENVGRAILRVRPAGVDAHTGVEAPDGAKDPARVRAFVEEARRAFALLGVHRHGC